MQLDGSVVVVTGASRGIGQAIAVEAARRGARLLITGRDAAALDATAARTGAHPVVADLRDPAAAAQLVAAALDRFGRVDGLVCNAGIGYAGPFAGMPAERIDAVVDTNLTAAVRLVHAAVPALRDAAPGSGVVLVGSIAGLLTVAGESVYSASKAGLAAFADGLRDELHPDGIAVTHVVPGVVDTDLLHGRGERYARRFPRPIPPERLAARIVTAMQRGAEQIVEPRWLTVAERVHALAPRTYRRLARRFG